MYVTTKGSDLLVQGSRHLGRAITITGTEGPTAEAGEAIDSAVHTLRSAMNWLEDTDDFEVAHQRLDQAGSYRRANFRDRCLLEFNENSGYEMTCPVALAHNRVGLSPGYIVRAAECSICHVDPEDCGHIAGHTYGGEVCHRILTELDILEVSFVGRPASPDARIDRIAVSYADLRDELGEQFHRGMPVTCDRCLKPCDGVRRPFEGSSHGGLPEGFDPLT